MAGTFPAFKRSWKRNTFFNTAGSWEKSRHNSSTTLAKIWTIFWTFENGGLAFDSKRTMMTEGTATARNATTAAFPG
jgi:hypothetical protein